jgi:hypothetical protein
MSRQRKGSDAFMTEEKINPLELIVSEVEVSGKETVDGAKMSAQVTKENVMFDFDLESLVQVEFADCTFDTEQDLAEFLNNACFLTLYYFAFSKAD